MKVLLVGSRGMLGGALARSAPEDIQLTALHRGQLDVTNHSAVEQVLGDLGPAWLINCSGVTNVEEAERDPRSAHAVNGEAVAHMARSCERIGAHLLHFSTDYVFDGRNPGFYSETDPVHPLNAYGRSKLAGEEAVRASGAPHLVIRTQWLFGTLGRSFAALMCDRAIARQPTQVVADETGCCTYTHDLAEATWFLMNHAWGTLHVANRGKVSRYDLARRIFERYGASEMLTPCSSSEYGAVAARPANSALSIRRAERILGRPMPAWEDALDRFLAERDADHKNHPAPAQETS